VTFAINSCYIFLSQTKINAVFISYCWLVVFVVFKMSKDVEIGYHLSCEEHNPSDLVFNAKTAEQVGFRFALISDHFHPWIDSQGNSAFVWSVIGAIANATKTLPLGTGVTCPTFRCHPAIIAHAAATCAYMMPDRFFLGVGTGENLNEHVVGGCWPSYDVRSEMLEEAIKIIRLLWEGGMKTFRGKFYTVDNAKIYTLPKEKIPIMIAAAGNESSELAGKLGDGFINVAPDAEKVKIFKSQGDPDRPCFGLVSVCCGEDKSKAEDTAFEWWPNRALPGELPWVLPTPAHFEQACQLVAKDDIKEAIVCGNNVNEHLDLIQKYVDAGFNKVYVHQIGPDQAGFFDFYKREVLPSFSK
jgi:coenzyme F420-dependent glucose-6-phosphate dehydrogenase